MMPLIKEKLKLFRVFSVAMIIKSLVFSLVLATIVVVPFIALLINILLIYIRYAYLLLILINGMLAVWTALSVYWFYDTLRVYKKDPEINIKHLLKIDIFVKPIIVFIIGVIIILIYAPKFLT